CQNRLAKGDIKRFPGVIPITGFGNDNIRVFEFNILFGRIRIITAEIPPDIIPPGHSSDL
ncbi:hypothetical protein, partial [Dehalococcoides mccartyi]|uniref:hypothetical protein n=1 Tax=Dehalococcoides mccartyi TaxID=61435 RepID=UPI00137482B0